MPTAPPTGSTPQPSSTPCWHRSPHPRGHTRSHRSPVVPRIRHHRSHSSHRSYATPACSPGSILRDPRMLSNPAHRNVHRGGFAHTDNVSRLSDFGVSAFRRFLIPNIFRISGLPPDVSWCTCFLRVSAGAGPQGRWCALTPTRRTKTGCDTSGVRACSGLFSLAAVQPCPRKRIPGRRTGGGPTNGPLTADH